MVPSRVWLLPLMSPSCPERILVQIGCRRNICSTEGKGLYSCWHVLVHIKWLPNTKRWKLILCKHKFSDIRGSPCWTSQCNRQTTYKSASILGRFTAHDFITFCQRNIGSYLHHENKAKLISNGKR